MVKKVAINGLLTVYDLTVIHFFDGNFTLSSNLYNIQPSPGDIYDYAGVIGDVRLVGSVPYLCIDTGGPGEAVWGKIMMTPITLDDAIPGGIYKYMVLDPSGVVYQSTGGMTLTFV
jgi:hypothetical protein